MTVRTATVVPLLALALLAGCSSLPRHQRRPRPPELVRAEALYRSGTERYRQGRWEAAATAFSRAAALHGSLDDQAGVARALAALGRTRLATDDTAAARLALRHALAAARGAGRPDLAVRALDGLAAAALARCDPAAAHRWLDRADSLLVAAAGRDDGSATADIPALRGVLWHDRGLACAQAGDTTAALAHLERALAFHEDRHDRAGVADDAYSLARLRLAVGAPEAVASALDAARRALALDRRLARPVAVARDLDLLASISLALGDTAAAADYRRRARLARSW